MPIERPPTSTSVERQEGDLDKELSTARELLALSKGIGEYIKGSFEKIGALDRGWTSGLAYEIEGTIFLEACNKLGVSAQIIKIAQHQAAGDRPEDYLDDEVDR